MILGHGKVKQVCLPPIMIENAIYQALAVKAGKLCGRYDLGALGMHHDEDSELHEFHNIDYIAYCLSPEQTA